MLASSFSCATSMLAITRSCQIAGGSSAKRDVQSSANFASWVVSVEEELKEVGVVTSKVADALLACDCNLPIQSCLTGILTVPTLYWHSYSAKGFPQLLQLVQGKVA